MTKNDNEKKFENIKGEIIKRLNEKKNNMGFNEQVLLIDWIFMQPIQQTISSNLIIWWPSIPMIALVWQETWRIYFIALKILLPDIY